MMTNLDLAFDDSLPAGDDFFLPPKHPVPPSATKIHTTYAIRYHLLPEITQCMQSGTTFYEDIHHAQIQIQPSRQTHNDKCKQTDRETHKQSALAFRHTDDTDVIIT